MTSLRIGSRRVKIIMRVQVVGPSQLPIREYRSHMRVAGGGVVETADVLLSRLLRVLIEVVRSGNFQNWQTKTHSFRTRIILKK